MYRQAYPKQKKINLIKSSGSSDHTRGRFVVFRQLLLENLELWVRLSLSNMFSVVFRRVQVGIDYIGTMVKPTDRSDFSRTLCLV